MDLTEEQAKKLLASIDRVMALCRIVYNSALNAGFSEQQAFLLAGSQFNDMMDVGNRKREE